MSLFTSTDFASASASGTDWRDTSKNLLEQLVSIRGEASNFNFGFLYISDHLASDTTSIFNLFKSVLKIDNWVGSVGMGVVGNGEAFVDMPAISAMIGHFPENSFYVFPDVKNKDDNIEDPQSAVKKWLLENDPTFSIIHGDPVADGNSQEILRDLESATNSFIIGGLTSSREQHYQIANSICYNSLSGVFLTDNVSVSTALSQGCNPIGGLHTITKADDFTILELDDKRALDVFQDNLRNFAAEKLGEEPQEFITNLKSMDKSDYIAEEYKSLFKGQVHVALPISLSDQNDFMVRNIVSIDMDEGSISISDNIAKGDNIMFVERNEESIYSELAHVLVNLRKRVQAERGSFEPKAALYISCIARGFSKLSEKDNKIDKNEMSLIRDIIGDIPLTGFYAGGEINNARLYGYAGVLTLFF